MLESCTSWEGMQINFTIFLFPFVNIYIGSRITITASSFIAVLFLFLIFSHLCLVLFLVGIIPV
jgi:hypothetical protein